LRCKGRFGDPDKEGDAWDKLKAGVDGAMDELEKASKQTESESK